MAADDEAAARDRFESDKSRDDDGFRYPDFSTVATRYLIVSPEKGGVSDLLRYSLRGDKQSFEKFLVTNFDVKERTIGDGQVDDDCRWVIMVSIVVRKIIAFLAKPMEWIGYLVDFLLNLLSQNGSIFGLLYNAIHGKVVIPQRGTETFISTIGHLDERVDLYKGIFKPEMESRALMDLCMMASKLAYENARVIKSVVNQHWKMHFVDFYDCWNEYQKDMSTQVFILSDKLQDANLILVSFRGTEPFDADDWSTDFDYSWYEIPNVGKIHMGFLEALGLGNRRDPITFYNKLQQKNEKSGSSDVSSNIDSDSDQIRWDRSSDPETRPEKDERTAYYTVRRKLKSLLNEHKNAKFVVTGHSLGGALAIMFPTVLVLHEEMEIMERLMGVYTYGQPRIGNRQLGSFMEAHIENPIPKYFRMVYCNDLVPRLPYDDKIFLYKHFGECLYYNSLYIEQRMKEEPNRNFFGLRYVIPEHLNAVWELMRGIAMGYIYGPDYKEGWFGLLARVLGLGLPGISAHCSTNYINSIRLGKESSI